VLLLLVLAERVVEELRALGQRLVESIPFSGVGSRLLHDDLGGRVFADGRVGVHASMKGAHNKEKAQAFHRVGWVAIGQHKPA
jgi:hypothetical protein